MYKKTFDVRFIPTFSFIIKIISKGGRLIIPEKAMEEYLKNKWIQAAACLLAALISILLIAPIAESAKTHQGTLDYLDGKRNTVMEISAAAIAASTAISLIPGDGGSQVAAKLADLSSYSMIVLCAVFLEKYLTTVTGAVVFRILIPIVCLMLIGYLLIKKSDRMRTFALRLGVFSLALYFAVPLSVTLSKTIESTYQTSIIENVENAKEEAEEITGKAEDQSIFSQFIASVTGGAQEIIKKFENMLNNLIESLAVVIVTSCLIPVFVLMVMMWLIKNILPAGVPYPSPERLIPLHEHKA